MTACSLVLPSSASRARRLSHFIWQLNRPTGHSLNGISPLTANVLLNFSALSGSSCFYCCYCPCYCCCCCSFCCCCSCLSFFLLRCLRAIIIMPEMRQKLSGLVSSLQALFMLKQGEVREEGERAVEGGEFVFVFPVSINRFVLQNIIKLQSKLAKHF